MNCFAITISGKCGALNNTSKCGEDCPFYKTVEEHEEQRVAARERCMKLGVPYDVEYRRATVGSRL